MKKPKTFWLIMSIVVLILFWSSIVLLNLNIIVGSILTFALFLILIKGLVDINRWIKPESLPMPNNGDISSNDIHNLLIGKFEKYLNKTKLNFFEKLIFKDLTTYRLNYIIYNIKLDNIENKLEEYFNNIEFNDNQGWEIYKKSFDKIKYSKLSKK